MTQLKLFFNFKFIFIYIILVTASYKGSAADSKDTTFLYRKVSGSSYHAIFIDRDFHSPFYEDLRKRISIDSLSYNDVIQQLKDSGFVVTKKT